MYGDLIIRAKAIAMHTAECSGDCDCCKYITQDLECGILRNVPAVDAVEVVRCKDCANRAIAAKCPMCHLVWFDSLGGMDCTTIDKTTDDGFCQKGAKMDKE